MLCIKKILKLLLSFLTFTSVLLLWNVWNFDTIKVSDIPKFRSFPINLNNESNEVLEKDSKIYSSDQKKLFKILKHRPLILLWIPPFIHRTWLIPNTRLCGGGCDVTSDRSLYEKSDALVFYMQGTDVRDRPERSKRRKNQPFIWWCHESPQNTRIYFKKRLSVFLNYFNWTMHYRTDSYVTASFIPYTARDWYLHRIGRSEESDVKTLKRYTSDKQFDVMFDRLLKRKKQQAIWVVSNCYEFRGAIKRMKFAVTLEKEGNYSIDIYGKCGNRTIPKRNSVLFDLIQTYKFNMAFENTKFCKDYVSEKFWYNSLYAGAVPVVWGTGKSDVEKVAPPHSFIHVDDFNGDPKQLSDYLKMLDKNITAYKEYFRWWTMPGFYPIHNLREYKVKGEPSVTDNSFDYEINGFCHLCKLLNEGRQYKTTTVVPSLKEHFYKTETLGCIR